MSLMHLLPDEMLGASGPMLDPGSEAYAVIMAFDDFKAPHKRLHAAHAALSAAAQPAQTERIKEIILAQAMLDIRHDAIIRGVWGFFTALAELVGAAEGASLLALRDYLVPDGLSSQNKTYGGEAGQAEQLAIRLTPEVRKRTDDLIIGEGAGAMTLTAYLDEWIAIGRKLGNYDAERGRIENAPSEGAELHNARLDWVRAENAMVSIAEMAGLSAVEMATVFGALQSAERKADERARETKAKITAQMKATADELAAAKKDDAEKAGEGGVSGGG